MRAPCRVNRQKTEDKKIYFSHVSIYQWLAKITRLVKLLHMSYLITNPQALFVKLHKWLTHQAFGHKAFKVRAYLAWVGCAANYLSLISGLFRKKRL